jgi:arginase family enzyme
MRNSLGQNYSRGVELSYAELARILPPKTTYSLIPSNVFQTTARDGAVSTLALSECERMLRSNDALQHNHSIFVGGDHLTSMCTVLASLKVHGNDFKLLWLDAHADIHNEKTSPSHNKHGMVVNMLINHKYAGIPRLNPSQVLYVGLRSTEPEEDAFIRKWKIRTITARDFLKNEMKCLREIAQFTRGCKAHVSLDVDVMDPSQLCATATPANNGLSLNQVLRIMGVVESESRDYYATDIMEYNPKKCTETPQDAAISRETMRAIFGFLV